MPVPNMYEEVAASHSDGAISYAWGTHNDTFHMILTVRSNGEPIAVPTQSNPADEDVVADRGIWHLIGEAYVGTPGAAGAVGLAVFWCRSKVGGGMSNVSVADSGNVTSVRARMLQNVTLTGNPINWTFTDTVDPASDAISFGPVPDTTVVNCLILCDVGQGIDSPTNQGSSGWVAPDLDTIGFAGHMNTDIGNGGGTMGGVGEKAVAGTCGTISHMNGWPTPSLQAIVAFAISDTETVGGSETGDGALNTLTLTAFAATGVPGARTGTGALNTETLTAFAGAGTYGPVTGAGAFNTLALAAQAGVGDPGDVAAAGALATMAFTAFAAAGVAGGRTGAGALNTLALAAFAGTPTGGPVTVAGALATLAFTAFAADAYNGNTVAGAFATVNLEAQGATFVPGNVTVAGAHATVTFAAQPGAPFEGGLGLATFATVAFAALAGHGWIPTAHRFELVATGGMTASPTVISGALGATVETS